jgi:hypothetical protein
MVTSWRSKAQFINKTASNSESLRIEISGHKLIKEKKNWYLMHHVATREAYLEADYVIETNWELCCGMR